MVWIDKKAEEQVLMLRDEFDIRQYVETGTFKGINARFQSRYFESVITVEKDIDNFMEAHRNFKGLPNVSLFLDDSASFLSSFKTKTRSVPPVLFFLDAHFYDPKLTSDKRWVVKNELKALEGFSNCLIMIHDFDVGGLGHLVYDGEHLNFDLIKEDILKVNPKFRFYHNERQTCDIMTPEDLTTHGIAPYAVALDNLKYAYTNDTKKYRGILYATPKELDLTKYDLREYGT